MKRILPLLLTVILCIGITSACSISPKNPSENGTDTGSTATSSLNASVQTSNVASGTFGADTAGSNYTGTASATSPLSGNVVYDPNMEHKIIVGDLKIPGIVVLDLNKCEDQDWSKLSDASAVVWEWDPQDSENCVLGKQYITGISDVKYRWSQYYQKNVVIACNSAGWVGIIDYETKATLWEIYTNNSPHALELMPNGDLVLICSGGSNWENGDIRYYPISANNATTPSSSLTVANGHGVCWDPISNVLWALGGYGVTSFTVQNGGTAEAQLVATGTSVEFDSTLDNDGHDMVPVYGNPGKYWVTAARSVWVFDSQALTLTNTYPHSGTISYRYVKGIANFADGTVVLTKVDNTTSTDYSTVNLQVITTEQTSGVIGGDTSICARNEAVTFESREFYKVHSFNANYQ